jgi:peptidoglycan/LPS O-acetylase OafA/YrhL
MNLAIELLRGIGALMVMLMHYRAGLNLHDTLSAGMWLGVDLFFVLSGFVFAPHLREGISKLGPFVLRRFARILPLYWVSLLLYVSIGQRSLEYFWSHVFLLQTLKNQTIATQVNPAFWSLPVEMCFYLALPILAIRISGISIDKRIGIITLFSLSLYVMIVVGIAQNTSDSSAQERWLWLHFQLPGRMLEFSLGFVAYEIAQSNWFRAQAKAALMTGGFFMLGSLYAAGSVGAIADPNQRTIILVLLPLLCALACLPLVAGLSTVSFGPRSRLLATHAGKLSYGVYLFHNLPALIWPNESVWLYVVLTFIFSYLCHYIIEAPAQKLARCWTSKT